MNVIINISTGVGAAILVLSVLLFLMGGTISCGIPDEAGFFGIYLFIFVLPIPICIGVIAGSIIKIQLGLPPNNYYLLLDAFIFQIALYLYLRKKRR